MSHDTALDAHEHREHAEHAVHQSDPFIARVSITIAVLAVLATAAGSLESVEGGLAVTDYSKSVLMQDQATDAWAEYQADSIKKHVDALGADSVPARAAEYRASSQDEGKKQGAVRARAQAAEADRDKLIAEGAHHEQRHHRLTGAATLIEIGIALSTVAIVTRRRAFWLAAMGLGVAGTLLFGATYVLA